MSESLHAATKLHSTPVIAPSMYHPSNSSTSWLTKLVGVLGGSPGSRRRRSRRVESMVAVALESRILLDGTAPAPPVAPQTPTPPVGPVVSPAQPAQTIPVYVTTPTAPPPPITIPATNQNIPASTWYNFWNGTGPVGLKATLIGTYGTPPVTVVTGGPPPTTTTGVPGGIGNVYTNIPPDYQVGPAGCGPCIGVTIVSPPDPMGNITVWVYHFSTGDNPYATLNNSGTFPPGSTVVINGGENTNPNSMSTLQNVNTYLTSNPNLTVIGYYNSVEIYVNAQGQYTVYQRPNYAVTDPTIIQPPPTIIQPPATISNP